MLFGAGVYRSAHQGGLIARKRLTAYAPAGQGQIAAAPLISASPLLRRRQFSSIGMLDRLLQRKDYGQKTSLELARAGLPLRVGEYLLARWVLALLLFVILRGLTHTSVIGLLGGVIGYFLPLLYVRMRQAKRVRLFDDQLVDGLVLIANALKSGYSFMQGMEAIAREMPEPMGAEFEQALSEVRVGGAVEESLVGISQRVRSMDFELVVTAMIIQRQVGGNMSEILSNIAYTVRERHRILREVRVLTAQERLSGYIIACLPVFLILILSVINPGYIGGMVAQTSGRLMLGLGFVMELLGLLVIRKIVDIDV
jgi:tight adherence protein B